MSSFTRIAFTNDVKAAQEVRGTRAAYAAMAARRSEESELGAAELAFIAAADSFYMATVSETGWPYVQHRGGPRGFLRFLGDETLGFADFNGNGQYLSLGNLAGNDRVCLFLMDYLNRRRLKLWGRARTIEAVEDPGLIARLEDPTYRARIERGFLIRIEAYDWNCPKHIPSDKRFTALPEV